MSGQFLGNFGGFQARYFLIVKSDIWEWLAAQGLLVCHHVPVAVIGSRHAAGPASLARIVLSGGGAVNLN